MEDESGKRRRKRKSTISYSEKKRRRTEQMRRCGKTRIVIADQFDRWRDLSKDMGMQSDAALAKMLLDSYFDKQVKQIFPKPTTVLPVAGSSKFATSTPVSGKGQQLLNVLQDISSLESDSSGKTLTGVETLPETDSENGRTRQLQSQELRSGRTSRKKTYTSFLNPFELSIDVSVVDEEEDEDPDQDSDSDYETSHFLTAVLPEEVNNSTQSLAFEELEFGMEVDSGPEEMDDEDSEEITGGPGILKISTEEDCIELTGETICLVYLNQLISLAEAVRKQCKECYGPVQILPNFVGSALYLKWTCQKGHVVYRWCSQPILNRRLHSGDFMVATATVTSGNNFGKLAFFAKMLKLKFPSANSFHRIQTHYLVPTVDNIWANQQDEVLASLRGKEIVILEYHLKSIQTLKCITILIQVMVGWTLLVILHNIAPIVMELDSKKVIDLKALDKRVTDRKSANMEKKGFQWCMENLEERGLTIREVVTDAHLGIGALMKSQYPNIKHSHDVWHAAKNLGKKILKAGQKKGCGVLLKWSKDIINHFWFSCKTANSYPEFMSVWRSVLHHITNQHNWVLAHGEGVNHCLHGPLTDEERTKPWLDKSTDALALSVLANVILDKRFLNKIHYLLNFRSTADLEVFNQLILMYCAKRFAYSPPVYRMRNTLAALDHNAHVDRPLRRNKEGNIMYHRYFNKKSGRWSVHPLKVAKEYTNAREIAQSALIMRLGDRVGMKRKKELEQQDPRRISTHLAPIPPPPTSQLVAEQKSRFDS